MMHYCPACGAELVANSRYCAQCGAALNAPVPPPAPEALDISLKYASLGRRAAACLLDILVLVLIWASVHMLLRLMHAAQPANWVWFLPSPGSFFTVSWIYHAVLESSPSQATYGKQVLKLRVTDLSGQRISFARANGRFLARLLSWVSLSVGFFMAAFTHKRQALHDMVAETVVLELS